MGEGLAIHQSHLDATARKERVGSLIQEVGLGADCLDRYPHEFSGGQRQRIAIARAMAVEPDLLVCDEPLSSLDVSIQAQVLKLFARLIRERDLTMVFISHDIIEAARAIFFYPWDIVAALGLLCRHGGGC